MQLSQEEIKKIIPHRDPFLLIDGMEELEPGVKGTGVWHLTGEESFFKGHFPGNPILPGVLMLEACAQAGAVVIFSHPDYQGLMGIFGGVKNVKFRHMVKPGDTLKLHVTVLRASKLGGNAKIEATVGDNLACSGEIMTIFAPWEGQHD